MDRLEIQRIGIDTIISLEVLKFLAFRNDQCSSINTCQYTIIWHPQSIISDIDYLFDE